MSAGFLPVKQQPEEDFDDEYDPYDEEEEDDPNAFKVRDALLEPTWHKFKLRDLHSTWVPIIIQLFFNYLVC